MSTVESALVQLFVVAFGEFDAVAAEDASWADVVGSVGEDAAGVVGKAVVPLGVEALAEAPEVGDEEAEGFGVFVVFEVHADFFEFGVEVVAGEGFGVFDLVGWVAVGADGDGAGVEPLFHGWRVMVRSGAMSMTKTLWISSLSR